MPVPNVIKESPDFIFVALNQVILRPEISRAELRKLLEIAHHFVEVGVDSREGCLGHSSADAFDYRLSAVDSINYVSKKNASPAVLWQFL